MIKEHWARAFLKQEIISISPISEGKAHHHLDLVELADKTKWICKKFYQRNWLGKIEGNSLELSEAISAKVASKLGISSVAYKLNNKFVFTLPDKAKAIITPFRKGECLSVFTEEQAFIMGGILAKLHHLKLPIAGAKSFPPVIPANHYPNWLLEMILFCNHHAQYQAYQWVVSHRDIHAQNIIWLKPNKPHLLDWESAGLIHPTIELIGLAQNCAGLADCNFQHKNFRSTLMGYGQFAERLPRIDLKLWKLSFHTWLLWYSFCLRQDWLKEAECTLEAIKLIREKAKEMQIIYTAI